MISLEEVAISDERLMNAAYYYRAADLLLLELSAPESRFIC